MARLPAIEAPVNHTETLTGGALCNCANPRVAMGSRILGRYFFLRVRFLREVHLEP